MKYKPFLSHKRQKAAAVTYLKQQLCLRGAGGWQDTAELPMGGQFINDIVRAIEEDTGGFIFWATKDTLTSDTICVTELPTALDRAKRDPTYPVVPVLVELYPGRDTAAVEAVLGKAYTQQLFGFNGVVRHVRQSLQNLARETARRYVKELVKSVPAGAVEVAVTAFRAPTEQHHLTLDWRPLFGQNTRTPEPGAIETFIEALADIREALQSRDQCPQISIEVALPLPLAMLVGYEWRWQTQLQVTVKTVNPGTGELLVVEPGAPTPRAWPAPRTATLPGSGPYVLAVSVGADFGQTVDRYAAEQDARGYEALHIDCDPVASPLAADDIRAIGIQVVNRLKALQADGLPKHLLLRGPASMAVAIGLAANAIGPTWVPFYDAHEGYAGGLEIG